MHSNPTAVEVAGKLLFDIKQDHAAPRDWAERLGKVVQLIHEERDGGNLLAFRAGHKAGIETYRWRSSSKCGWRNSPWLT
jgi:hypothetical protein